MCWKQRLLETHCTQSWLPVCHALFAVCAASVPRPCYCYHRHCQCRPTVTTATASVDPLLPPPVLTHCYHRHCQCRPTVTTATASVDPLLPPPVSTHCYHCHCQCWPTVTTATGSVNPLLPPPPPVLTCCNYLNHFNCCIHSLHVQSELVCVYICISVLSVTILLHYCENTLYIVYNYSNYGIWNYANN